MPDENIPIRINGTVTACGPRSQPGAFDRALKGIAMSDSPILLRAKQEADAFVVAKRLHALSRRNALPLRLCRLPEEAALLGVLGPTVQGAWVLPSVSGWPPAAQRSLVDILVNMDALRLSGRISQAHLPRVIVIEKVHASGLIPELEQRLSFFCIRLD